MITELFALLLGLEPLAAKRPLAEQSALPSLAKREVP